MDARLIANAIALSLLVANGALGCSSDKSCTAQAVAGVSLTVTNSASGTPICDAKITAHGTADATIMPSPGGSQCGYSGLFDQPGTYDLAIERDGFDPKTLPGVTVGESADGCHHAVTYVGKTSLDPIVFSGGDAGH